MTKLAFCYHCRRYHPEDEMKNVLVGGRSRWRCKKSLDATVASQAARDAYGQMIRAQNERQSARRASMPPLPHCVAELNRALPLDRGDHPPGGSDRTIP